VLNGFFISGDLFPDRIFPQRPVWVENQIGFVFHLTILPESSMLRTIAWATVAVCWILGELTGSLLAAQNAAPNIVLIITDDQGYGPLGRHGHPWLKTPHLDRLHDVSTRFTRFLVSPTCSPTRSALMTGRHSMRNGITHTILERERLTLNAVTLPQILKKVGYTTGIFGKWHLGDEEPYQPHNRGFDETFIHGAGGIGQAYACSCADAPDNSYFDPVIRYNGQFVKTQWLLHRRLLFGGRWLDLKDFESRAAVLCLHCPKCSSRTIPCP
jgi:hypothetical protein